MDNLICQYCNTRFTSISSLNNHTKKTKYCLVIQGKLKPKEEFKCSFCSKILSTKQNLEIHIKKCQIIEDEKEFKCDFCQKCLSTKQSLIYHLDICDKKKDKELIEKIEKLEKKENELIEKLGKKEKEIIEKDKIIIKINFQLENYKEQFKKQEHQITELQNKLDKIANKAIDRPTTTNNTVNNKIELYTFPSQKEIDNKIESQFNDKYLWDGMKGVAQFVYDHIVKLEDGSMAYACFDTSRQIFKYKDENGNEIKDPKAVKLRKMIKPGLLRQSQTLLDYFNDECDYLEKRKNNGIDIDRKEYNTMNILREKAFEVGAEILSIDDTNKFGSELANLSC